MKTKLIYLIICFISASFIGKAQTNKEDKTFKLHIMPLALADYQPRLRIGGEYYFKDRISFSFDIEKGSPKLNTRRLKSLNWTKDYSFLGYRSEFKFFIFETSSFARYYIGIEGFYFDAFAELSNDKYVPAFQPDKYWKMNKIGANLKFGHQLYIKQWLTFDTYIGFGFRHKTTKYEFVQNSIAGGSISEDKIKYDEIYQLEEENTKPNVVLGLTLGLIVF